LSAAPFKEIFIPKDTQDAGAIASRKQLQEILDQHPTAPTKNAGVVNKAVKQTKKAARRNQQ
jgi:hypothetical protein